MLPSNPKIEDITQGEIFQPRFNQTDEKNDEIPFMDILEEFGAL